MNQNETVKNLILSNFSRLNKDEFVLLANMLSLKELAALCMSSKEINEYCKKYDLFENRARKYVMDETPLAEPIYSFRDQVELIKRGFSTIYTIEFGVDENGIIQNDIIKNVRFGLPDSNDMTLAMENNEVQNQRPIQIKGFPSKKGTEVYIVGNVREEYDGFFEYLLVYESLEQIKNIFEEYLEKVMPNEFYSADDNPNYQILNLISWILDDILDEYGYDIEQEERNRLALKKFNDILRDEKFGNMVVKRITLP